MKTAEMVGNSARRSNGSRSQGLGGREKDRKG